MMSAYYLEHISSLDARGVAHGAENYGTAIAVTLQPALTDAPGGPVTVLAGAIYHH